MTTESATAISGGAAPPLSSGGASPSVSESRAGIAQRWAYGSSAQLLHALGVIVVFALLRDVGRRLVLEHPPSSPGLRIALIVVLAVAYFGGMFYGGLFRFGRVGWRALGWRADHLGRDVLFGVCGFLVAAGILVALVTAVLFTVAHFEFEPVRLALLFSQGIVFGLLRRAGSSLYAPAVAHTLLWTFVP